MRGPAIFVVVVLAMLAAAIGGIAYVVSKAGPGPRPRTALAPVEVTPDVVELGTISQCGDPIVLKASLRNAGAESFHVNQVVAACGCTVPDLTTPFRIDPGQTIDFTVALDPWAAAGAQAQQVDFIYAEASRAPPFRVRYEVVSPLRTVPGAAHRTKEPGAVIKITADDGTHFTIRSVDPPVAEQWILTPSSETHVTIDWALVDEAAKSRPELFEFDSNGTWRRGKLTIETGREGCPAIHMRLYNDDGLEVPLGVSTGAQPS
ncbi:MAG: DUF1573 domain-containing protein [Phycisphaerae bacterium]|nr:DUF1573 domain-containing protein [Phycisphaerae bacterium]